MAALINNINALFLTRCDYNHTKCSDLTNKCLNLIRTNPDLFNMQLLTSYFQFINNPANYYNRCIQNHLNWIPLAKKAFEILNPTENILQIICESKIQSLQLIHLLEILGEKNLKLPHSLLTIIFKNNHKNLMSSLEEFLIGNFDFETNDLELIFSFSSNLNFKKKVIEIKNISPNLNCLINSITCKCVDSANYLLKEKQIIPNKACLDLACSTKQALLIEEILKFKILPDTNTFNSLIGTSYLSYGKYKGSTDVKFIASIIDLLIQYGLIIDIDHVYSAMKKGCIINDINRFNLNFDNKYIELCTELDFYPYPNINISPTMKCLHYECKKPSNVAKIKKLIKSGLKPDITCLRLACDTRSNVGNIKFLIVDCGIKPDLECLKNIIKHNSNASVNIVLDHYERAIKNTNNTADSAALKNNLITEKKKDVSEDEDEDSYSLDESDNSESEESKEFSFESSKNISDDSNEKCEDDKNNKTSENETKVEQEKKLYDILEVKEKIIFDKKTLEINDIGIKVLNLNKNKKYTILTIRKELINYINKNNLIDNEKKNLIYLDDNLSKIVKVSKPGKYIDFTNIDHIIGCLLK